MKISNTRSKIVRYNLRLYLSLIIQSILFFVAAGNFHIERAWIFFIIMFFYYVFSFVIIYKFNSEVIIARGGSAFKKDTKILDKYMLLSYTILGVYGQFIIAGLDIGRFQWLLLDLNYLWVGLILYFISIALIIWAMIKNPFFEATIRIQKERNQKVVKSGPYHFIRHPGYLSGILWHYSIAMILGSGMALIFAMIIAAIFIYRTYIEDNFLKKELKGYEKYAREVKYRLLPQIW